MKARSEEQQAAIDRKCIARIAAELELPVSGVKATATLLDGGATVPFVARYRKEATGSLDEVSIAAIRDSLGNLRALDSRREVILNSLAERELLTPDLEKQIEAAQTMAILEDVYLPYRPKRRTRATIAKEKGLKPLADLLWESTGAATLDVAVAAAGFLNEEKGVTTVEEALAGARDILAEIISEDAGIRGGMRDIFRSHGMLRSRVVKGHEEEGKKYKDYFDWCEPASKAPSHRVLAMRRGEKEGHLLLRLEPPEELALRTLLGLLSRTRPHLRLPRTVDSISSAIPGQGSSAADHALAAMVDGYKRLLSPSMATETGVDLKQRADEEAIRVFAGNLRELLLAPPLGAKRLLALDPGFRTGCKLVCLDGRGSLLHSDTIFPHTGGLRAHEAGATLQTLCREYSIEAIAIGNGTAGRETETFVRALDLPKEIIIVMVNESGASVYSASEVAREEFPDEDLTVRGTISIGRRLMDPLAELIKIDPKAIGVGQYQHDVDQKALRRSLDDVVMSCVNAVGVDLNTASKQLLTYVSGLGPQLAQNIVDYRATNGSFTNRKQLNKVTRLGPKAFEQSAGFLRIRGGANLLDASAVHPESYPVVVRIAKDLGCQPPDLMGDSGLRARIDLHRYITDQVGLPTLRDIVAELAKPGRDPRDEFEAFGFTEGILTIEDLRTGMTLSGVVTNVTAFGAFVDVGVHQDGLVHISQLADRYVRDPAEIVKVQQKVKVTVLEVDLDRKRISLSMKTPAKPTQGD